MAIHSPKHAGKKAVVSGRDDVKPASPGGAPLKKPEFLERSTARTDVKKRDAKPAIEAALAVLAEALAKGEEIVLPPLGKIKVIKSKQLGNGAHVMTLKLRTMKDGAGQKKIDGMVGLADADDAV
jgi:nucleoid DNA-binding protein